MKNTKKLFALLLIAAMLPIFGCNKATTASGKITVPKPVDLAESIKTGAKFQDQLDTIDLDTAATLYSIDKSTVADSLIYMGTGSTPEEIAVFTANSEADADKIAEACNTRIEDQKESFKNYIPAEMPKLESSIVKQSGTTVVLCVSADNEAATKIITDALK